MSQVTRILEQLDECDPQAAERLLPHVYDDLRRRAAALMANEGAGQTLDATGLVHEAYLRLVGPANAAGFANRGHFFAAAAEAMRRILVERARRKRGPKAGGAHRRAELELDHLATTGPDLDLLALNDALDRLAQESPARAELVKLRFFAGLTSAEAAEVLGVSVATAERHWVFARAWLYAELDGFALKK
jgi:RNA polymerase sigma factor (TIGR02999 family)